MKEKLAMKTLTAFQQWSFKAKVHLHPKMEFIIDSKDIRLSSLMLKMVQI